MAAGLARAVFRRIFSILQRRAGPAVTYWGRMRRLSKSAVAAVFAAGGMLSLLPVYGLFLQKAAGPRHKSQLKPSAPPASQRLDAWRILGPGGGGSQYLPAISPHDPNIVLVSSDMSGAYISRNGGISWRMFNLGGAAHFFVFDPHAANVIYAGTGSRYLWRSEDTGTSWHLVHPPPAAVNRAMYIGDEGSLLLMTRKGLLPGISTLAIDPDDTSVMYATVSNTLSISRDRGTTWETLGKLATGSGRAIYIDPRSPKGNRTVYVIGWDRVGVLEDGQWRLQESLGKLAISEGKVSMGSDGRPVIYVLTNHMFTDNTPTVAGGLLVSHDRGATWEQAHRTLIETLADPWFQPTLRGFTVLPENPDVIYLSLAELRLAAERDRIYVGVVRSTDRGRTWEYIWKETSAPAANIRDAWITERFSPYWGESPHAYGIFAGDPALMYGTDLGRTMKSTDGGATWEAVYSVRAEDGTYTTTGLDVTTAYGVHFDPFDTNRIFISYTDIGLFGSENGGQTWASVTRSLPRSWANTTYWMTFDPEVQGRAWAVMSNTHDLPRARIFERRGTAAFKGGVALSNDGGRTWEMSNGGMPEVAATHIVLDPASPAGARTLYVAGFGKGVYKSTDGGRNWELKTNGLPEKEPLVWRLAMSREGVLYAVLARRSSDGSFGNDRDGAVYRSHDKGENWERLPLPPGANGPTSLAIDPEDSNRLYLSVWCRSDRVYGTPVDGGVYLSADGGATWRNIHSRDQFVYDVSIDPSNPRVLYTAGFQSSAWRSADRGETWTRIAGYNFKNGHRVIPDPRDPSMVFITTFGGSVWYGPAAGDPNAAEDIASPGLPLQNGLASVRARKK